MNCFMMKIDFINMHFCFIKQDYNKMYFYLQRNLDSSTEMVREWKFITDIYPIPKNVES